MTTIIIHALIKTTHVFIKERNLRDRFARQIYQLANTPNGKLNHSENSTKIRIQNLRHLNTEDGIIKYYNVTYFISQNIIYI